MSAIYGCIDLSKQAIECGLEEQMRNSFARCVIDRYAHIQNENVMMGCGIQFFTQEAKKERLPITENEVFFTADVYLKNRQELLEMLGLREDHQMPDGDILFKIYHQCGQKGLEKVCGSFAFVYYDRKRERIDLVADATSDRALFYSIQGEKLYFGTLLKTIAPVIHAELNEEYIATFFAMDDYGMFYDAETTHFQEIKKVSNAQIVRITKDGITKIKYWEPLKTCKKIKGKSDEWFKQQFKQLYQTSIHQSMRSEKECGIYLSGGLDSSSIACLAAPMLKKQGKSLYAYTMVPEEGFEGAKSNFFVYDESKWVEETISYYPNIIPHYHNFHGKNCWNIMDEMIEIYEVPYKSLQNPVWLADMAKAAYQEGCRIVLSGQFGNSTVSFGEYNFVYSSLCKQGHFLTLIHELNACKKNYNIGRKKMLMILRDIRKNSKVTQDIKEHMLDNVLLKQELIDRYHLNDKMYARRKNQVTKYTVEDYYEVMLDTIGYRHIGEFETKQSLYTGVLVQDPTRDKRMIEFILCLPLNQFVHNGCQRRLIREYLKDELPMSFVQDFKHRGKQAEDTFYRAMKDLELKAYMIELHNSKSKNADFTTYLDAEKVNQYLDRLFTSKKESVLTERQEEMNKVMQAVMIDRIIKKET